MLKALLQLLLNTRTTKTEAAHFAQPAWGASPIVMTGTDVNDDWGSIYQGVMPNQLCGWSRGSVASSVG